MGKRHGLTTNDNLIKAEVYGLIGPPPPIPKESATFTVITRLPVPIAFVVSIGGAIALYRGSHDLSILRTPLVTLFNADVLVGLGLGLLVFFIGCPVFCLVLGKKWGIILYHTLACSLLPFVIVAIFALPAEAILLQGLGAVLGGYGFTATWLVAAHCKERFEWDRKFRKLVKARTAMERLTSKRRASSRKAQ